MKVVGDKLRHAREKKGWTPEAAAKATKIKVGQIVALESGDYSSFASASYARGFVRIYARALELDETPLLTALDGNLEDRGAYVTSPVEYLPERVDMGSEMKANQFGLRIMAVLAVLLIAIVGWYVYQAYRTDLLPGTPQVAPASEAPAAPAPETDAVVVAEPVEVTPPKAEPLADPSLAAAPAATPVTAEEAAAEASPIDVNVPAATGANHEITLQAVRTSWARVEAVDGSGNASTVFEGIIEEGQQQTFQATQFNLKIAIPAAVNIIWDGQNFGPYSNGLRPESFSIPGAAAQ